MQTGAGISTPAIPDFRSSTGLFKTLAKDPYSNLGAGPCRHEVGLDAGNDESSQESTRIATNPPVRKRRRSSKGVIVENGHNSSDPDLATKDSAPSKKMTVGGVGGIRSGKDLFDVRCLSDPSLLPAHHSLLNTLHRLTQMTSPTKFHRYMKTLDDEGRLLRVYTQNIDGLEGKAGLDLRPPVNVTEGLKVERKWKREKSRLELELKGGNGNQANPPVQAHSTSQHPINEGSVSTNENEIGSSKTPMLSCQSREGSPSRYSTTDGGCESLSETERALMEPSEITSKRPSGDRNMSTQPNEQVVTSSNLESSPNSIKTDLSGRFGYLKTDSRSYPGPVLQHHQQVPVLEPPPKEKLVPRAVPLHGVLSTMDCTRCSYSLKFEECYPLPADLLTCPSCETNQEERIAANQRARSVGVLRASVLLYNEPCKHDTAIGKVVEKDVLGVRKDDRPDLLIVAGTTLKIPGVVKIVKQLSNALKVNCPDEKVKARTKRKAAMRKRKRKMKDEGLTVESTDDDEDEDGLEQDDEPFTVDNFPIRTILLNRDAPAKVWEDCFDVWVQGDLQEFMHHWVTHGPSPADMENTTEWMWKKGARERSRLARAKLNTSLSGSNVNTAAAAVGNELQESNSGSPGSATVRSSLLDNALTDSLSSNTLGKKKQIELGIGSTQAAEWLTMQRFGWERPPPLSQMIKVHRYEGNKFSIRREFAGVALVTSQVRIEKQQQQPQQQRQTETTVELEGSCALTEPVLTDVPDLVVESSAPRKLSPQNRPSAKSTTLKVTKSEELASVAARAMSASKKRRVQPSDDCMSSASTVTQPGIVSVTKKKRGRKPQSQTLASSRSQSLAVTAASFSSSTWDRMVEGSLSPAPPSSEYTADNETSLVRPLHEHNHPSDRTVEPESRVSTRSARAAEIAAKAAEEAPRRSARTRLRKTQSSLTV